MLFQLFSTCPKLASRVTSTRTKSDSLAMKQTSKGVWALRVTDINQCIRPMRDSVRRSKIVTVIPVQRDHLTWWWVSASDLNCVILDSHGASRHFSPSGISSNERECVQQDYLTVITTFNQLPRAMALSGLTSTIGQRLHHETKTVVISGANGFSALVSTICRLRSIAASQHASDSF